jgi:hypothetical protein
MPEAITQIAMCVISASLSSGRGHGWHGIANINARKSCSAAHISGKFSWALPPSG